MKEKIKNVVLKPVYWFILAAFAVNNLFFENWYGGNYEMDNTVFEYVIAGVFTTMFFTTKFAHNKISELYDRLF